MSSLFLWVGKIKISSPRSMKHLFVFAAFVKQLKEVKIDLRKINLCILRYYILYYILIELHFDTCNLLGDRRLLLLKGDIERLSIFVRPFHDQIIIIQTVMHQRACFCISSKLTDS